MKLSGMTCPHCNAPLNDIEDGRVNFFCTYCGSSLYLDIDNSEANRIIEIKVAEASLNNAKANYASQYARKIEAETERDKYKDSLKQNTGSKMSGLLFMVGGAALCIIGVIAILLFVFVFKISFMPTDGSGFTAVILYGIPLYTILGGMTLAVKGWALFSIPVGANRMRIEKEIDDLNNRINSLQIEAENHRKIIMESGSAVFGAKGSLKRNSKQRLEQVESEICQAKNRIRELEKKLSGDYE